MSKILSIFLTGFICFFSTNSFGQCTNYEEVLNEGFENSDTVPGWVSGTVYHTTPQSFCPHSGSKALYLNFVNGYTGVAYDWSIDACASVSYKFSFWAKDCWSSTNNITVSVEDDNGTVITSTNIITNNQWSQYTLGPFTTSVAPLHFIISTNSAGGGGNDLSIDDIILEACTPEAEIVVDPIAAITGGVCMDAPIHLEIPTTGISYNNPVYQWQSNLNGDGAWIDIPGATTTFVDLVNYENSTWIRCLIAESGNINDVNCRFETEPIILVTFPVPIVNPPVDWHLCSNIGSVDSASFDLHLMTDDIRTIPTDIVRYFKTLADAEANTNELIQVGYINETNPDSIYVRIFNNFGCYVIESFEITAYEQPTVDLGADTSLCEGQPIILDATYSNTDATYLWHDGSTEPTFSVTEQGLHSVEITLGPCSIYDEIQLTLYQLPNFEFGPDIDKCIDDTVYLDPGISGASYTWNTGSTDEILMVTEFGEYELEVETECGTHRDVISVDPIFCGCPIDFPNAISPNGDGLNDYFLLEPECPFQVYDLMIYDRWGKEVFRSVDPTEKWAGPTDADPHQTMYVYYLKYTFLYSPAFEKNGTITIFQ